MEYRIANGKGYLEGNNTERNKDSITPDDQKGKSQPFTPTPSEALRNMVCQHVVIKGQVKTRKHMRKCLYPREIHTGNPNDIQEGCQEVTD